MRHLAAIALLTSLLAGGAHADDARAARQHYERGTSLYDIGQFREAAHEYEEAYKAKNDPALLFNIGQAYRGGNDYPAAITAYRAYLRRLPAAPNRADVEEHIARMQRELDERQRKQAEPPPVTPPPVTLTPPPATATLVTTPTAAPAERPPLYKKWWLWAAVGGAAAVVVGVSVGVAYALPKNAPTPAGAYPVTF